jgi:hypothetical protein
MNAGHYRIDFAGLGWLGGLLGWRRKPVRLRPVVLLLPVLLVSTALLVGVAARALLPAFEDDIAEIESLWPKVAPAQGPAEPAAATVPSDAPAPTSDAAAPEGLRISSQSWRRGGLGSKAMVTFTLRNDNDYAVKDVEIVCSFSRRDGSHLTDRQRVLPDTVNMKSRRIFSRVHVGFVNVNADRVKCSPVAASRL